MEQVPALNAGQKRIFFGIRIPVFELLYIGFSNNGLCIDFGALLGRISIIVPYRLLEWERWVWNPKIKLSIKVCFHNFK